VFDAIVDLPVPSSFLLDGKGRLAAIYRGSVSVERILTDAALAAKDNAAARSAAALPWQGRWLQMPDPPDPSVWLNDFGSQHFWDEAFAFFQRHSATLRLHKDFTRMAASLGDNLSSAGKHGSAITVYDAALAKSPESPEVLNNLASLLATAPDKSVRNPARALELARKAVALTNGKNPALLDTLASAQAATGDFPSAAATASSALDLARTANQTSLIPLLEKSLAAYKAGRIPP
jgi:tetratricopeptide (TPR) repeat protein